MNGVAHVAQLVEHVLGKDEVTRSIRVVGSSDGWPAGLRQSGSAAISISISGAVMDEGGGYGEGEI